VISRTYSTAYIF